MSLSKGIQSAAAAALSAAMLIAVAACGTTDGTDTASKSGDSSKDSSSTSIQGFDTSSIQKDDEIAALLPDSVAGDGTLTVGTDTSYAPAEFLAEDGKTPVGFDVDLSKALAAAGCPVVSLTSDTMSLEDIFLQITEPAPEEAQPEETEEPATEAAAAQPEQSAEPAEPQAPADDTPEQPEAENDQKEEE